MSSVIKAVYSYFLIDYNYIPVSLLGGGISYAVDLRNRALLFIGKYRVIHGS